MPNYSRYLLQYALAIKSAPQDHDEMMKDMKMDGPK